METWRSGADTTGVVRAIGQITDLATLARDPGAVDPEVVHCGLTTGLAALPGVRHADLQLVEADGRCVDAWRCGPFGDLERYRVTPSRGGTLLDWVLATGEPALSPEPLPDGILGPDLRRWGIEVVAAFPLVPGGRTVAAAALSPATDLDDAALAAAEALVAVAVGLLALAGAQQDASHDPLTGCLNHGAMLERIAQELARAERHGHRLGCVLLDLDNFKAVNDHHGHAAGDDVLRAVGAALRDAFRTSDVVARYGGDEFVVLVPDSDERALMTTAHRTVRIIRDVTVSAEWAHRNGTPLVRTSVGAELSRAGDTPASLLGRADTALSAGKRAGKDRVVQVPR